jgi:hypothetical protein
MTPSGLNGILGPPYFSLNGPVELVDGKIPRCLFIDVKDSTVNRGHRGSQPHLPHYQAHLHDEGLADLCTMEGSHVTRRKRRPLVRTERLTFGFWKSSVGKYVKWILIPLATIIRSRTTCFAGLQARVGLRSTHTILGNGVHNCTATNRWASHSSSQRQSRVQRGERRSAMNGFKPCLAGANY